MNEMDILKAMNGIEEEFLDTRAVKRHSRAGTRRTAAVAAAACAALAMTVTAGAVIYSRHHSSSVERYIAEGESLSGNAEAVMESSRLRLTIDKVLCDGRLCTLILTAEAKDGQARAAFEDELTVCIGDSVVGVCELYRKDGDPEDSYSYICELDSEEAAKTTALTFRWGGESFKAALSLEKNLDTAEFVSADGRSITLSPIAAYLGKGFTLPSGADSVLGDMELILRDGSRQPVPHSGSATVHGGYETVGSTTEVEYERRFFGTVLDIADISAVTVRGTEFYKR